MRSIASGNDPFLDMFQVPSISKLDLSVSRFQVLNHPIM